MKSNRKTKDNSEFIAAEDRVNAWLHTEGFELATHAALVENGKNQVRSLVMRLMHDLMECRAHGETPKEWPLMTIYDPDFFLAGRPRQVLGCVQCDLTCNKMRNDTPYGIYTYCFTHRHACYPKSTPARWMKEVAGHLKPQS